MCPKVRLYNKCVRKRSELHFGHQVNLSQWWKSIVTLGNLASLSRKPFGFLVAYADLKSTNSWCVGTLYLRHLCSKGRTGKIFCVAPWSYNTTPNTVTPKAITPNVILPRVTQVPGNHFPHWTLARKPIPQKPLPRMTHIENHHNTNNCFELIFYIIDLQKLSFIKNFATFEDKQFFQDVFVDYVDTF